MKKRILTIALVAIGMVAGVQAALVNYTFDQANVMNAQMTGTAGMSASAIAYTQGTTSGTGDSAVSYESNVAGDNLFALCSRDLGVDPGSSFAYDANQSRFQFTLTPDAGNALDFSSAVLSLDMIGISDNTATTYDIYARYFYSVNGGAWVSSTTVRRGLDADLAGSGVVDHAADTTLFNNSTDAALAGYALDSGASVFESKEGWQLNTLGQLNADDSIEFAVFMFDTRAANANFYAGADDIQVQGFNVVVPEPATIGLLGIGALVSVMVRRARRQNGVV